jgi:hypothetical protein
VVVIETLPVDSPVVVVLLVHSVKLIYSHTRNDNWRLRVLIMIDFVVDVAVMIDLVSLIL